MLVQKQNDSPYIAVFKVSTGEEFVCKVADETTDTWVIEHPLCMVATQQGMQFAPFMMMVDPKGRLSLSKSMVIVKADAITALESQYESITTGIALPKKSSIIV
jgi:hypothetical protein